MIRRMLLAGDDEEGNGGSEVLRTLVDFCHHANPPPEDFGCVRHYLDYRWDDIANRYIISLSSSFYSTEAIV